MTRKYTTDLELAGLDDVVCSYWRRADHSPNAGSLIALVYLHGVQDGVRSGLHHLTYSELDSELSLLLEVIRIREAG